MPVARSKIPEAALQDMGDRCANIGAFCLVLVAFGLFGVVASGQIREEGIPEIYAWSVVAFALACFFVSLAPLAMAGLRAWARPGGRAL